MPNFLIEFEVFCGTCGAGLCNQSNTDIRNGNLQLSIEACEKCKEHSYNEGYDKGYDDAQREET